MLLSSLIFECWRVNSRDRVPIPWRNRGQDVGWAAIWRCLKFWSLEEALGAERQVAVSTMQGGKGSDAKVKRFTGRQEKTGGWINRGSFSLSSYESHKSWNYLKYFTYSYISFIFHLSPLFCSYSPVLLSFKSHPALISCFLVPRTHFGILLLLSVRCILQAFHISETLQAVLLSLSHWVFGLWGDTVLNQLEIFLSKKKKIEKLNRWLQKKKVCMTHIYAPDVYGSDNRFMLFVSAVSWRYPTFKT